MPDKAEEKPPNVILEAFGERRQTIGARVANDLVLAMRKELVEEKARARDEDLQEPTLTWLVQSLLRSEKLPNITTGLMKGSP